jgi:hypothetical protein
MTRSHGVYHPMAGPLNSRPAQRSGASSIPPASAPHSDDCLGEHATTGRVGFRAAIAALTQ